MKSYMFAAALLVFSVSSTASANNPPKGNAGGPYTIFTGDSVWLDGSVSVDPDMPLGDRIVSYEWDLNGDGIYDAAGPNAFANIGWDVLAVLLSGFYPANPQTGMPRATVWLRVKDSYGMASVVMTTLTVYGGNPTAQIVVHPNPCYLGSTLSFDGSGSYASSPSRHIVAWDWTISGTGGVNLQFAGSQGTWTPPLQGVYTVTLVVQDNFGSTGQAQTSLTVTGCAYELAGDINKDCRVDLEDFVQFAANWLVDCIATPAHPSCIAQ